MVVRGSRAAAVVLIAVALAGSGCSRRGATGDEEADSARVRNGEIAPDFEVADLTGQPVKLSALDGRVRLLDFWATWCSPCREEIPMLNELHREYGGAGLSILALSDEDAQILREFAADTGITYTSLANASDVAERYGVLGLPTAFLVDREGKVVETFFGAKSRPMLEQRIRTLLGLEPEA
jgi:peroxiredoxin